MFLLSFVDMLWVIKMCVHLIQTVCTFRTYTKKFSLLIKEAYCAKISYGYLISKVLRINIVLGAASYIFFQSFQNASKFITLPICAQVFSVKLILKLIRHVSVLIHHLQGVYSCVS